ncbi:AAA family ATPase [Mesorhizobium sp. 1B3]|uniref:ATP-binding protein n=1 Tax=Mesorhizobium sp. 1B3 TaxID=3243599 RepID=UPI003D975763
MRLSRLDLTRYGKFTDFSVDFGKVEAGRPDLHVIYGPNEAGKSTSFAAYLDLLFGIEQRTRYAFLHPYPSMRIGGVLDFEDGEREVIRIKRPQNSLLDQNAQPVDEAIVLGGLRAIDREAYRTMFSLDDDSIEAGGESILASKGDLGQLLFSASAGLAHLSQALAQLRAEADVFYRYRARSGELVELKTRLAALKEEREKIDTLAIDYARLVEARDIALTQYEAALRDRAAVQSRMEEASRHFHAIPRLAELRSRQQVLASLDGLPQPPSQWAAELPRLQKAEIEFSARRDAVAAEIQTLECEISGITVDEGALALTGQLEHLADLRARHVTADKDLPDRCLRLAELEREIAATARSLDWPGEPSELLLDTLRIARLRDLIERRSGIDAALASARTEHAKAERLFADVERQAADGGLDIDAGADMTAPMIALTSALAAFRADDHAARRRLAERACAAHRQMLSDRLAALAPWKGDVDALAAIRAPLHREIESLSERLASAERNIADTGKETARLRSEERRLRTELQSSMQATGLVTDQQAAAARMEREQAWARHRAALDGATADAFEALLRNDDIVTSARLGRAVEVERLNQVAKALALVEAALADQIQARSAAEGELRVARETIALVLAATSPALPCDMELHHLEDWLRRREEALEAGRLLRQAERDLGEAVTDGEALAGQLSRALDEARVSYPTDASPEMLMAAAQSALDKGAQRAALRRRLVDCRDARDARLVALAEAEAADAEWQAALIEACAGCWLAERVPDVAGLRAILARLADLEPVLRERSGLADRIAKMEQDQAAFAGELALVAQKLGIPATGTVMETYRDLCTRVGQARTGAELLADRTKRLEDARRRAADIEAQTGIDAAHRAEMMALFEVETLSEVAERLRAVEQRAGLREQIGALSRGLLEAVGVRSIEEVEALLEGMDRSLLEQQLAELKARFDDLDQRSRELFTAHSKAVERVEAIGGDDAVARIEQERRTLLLEIEEKARAYFRLRAGTVAAEAALRTYRERHRSAMMERASEAFVTMSRGAYSGLAAQPERDSEILIAKAADGTSKVASDLSRGTRFQLYLALRVAGYLEFAKARRPVPFVADDIMETFDDFRAEEAFRLFGEMAKVGQVIYLTHHQHLCGIAQRVCPGTRIHELPGAKVTGQPAVAAAP